MNVRVTRWLAAIAMGSMLVSCSPADNDSADGEKAALDANSIPTALEPEPHEVPAEAPALQEPESNVVQEPQVEHQAAPSPDGRYRIETFGVNDAITAAGLFPAAEIRLIDTSSEEVKWSTHGYYRQSFLWSPDSRYAAVYAEARTYGETFLVDADAMDAIHLPHMDAIAQYWKDGAMTENENLRHDPYFRPVEWLDNDRLRIAFEWNGGGDDRYSGTYVFDAAQRELLEVEWTNSD